MFGVKQVVAVALWGGLVVGSAGCGGDRTGEAATTSTPTTAVETTPSTLDPETEVEQAYLAFEDMFRRLRENPDPDDPEIAKRTTGQAQNDIVNALTTAASLGERATFGSGDAEYVTGVELADSHATVHSCAVEDITITNSAGGTIGPRVTTYWTKYTLRRQGGAWLVTSWEPVRKVDGEQSCE